MMRAVALIPAYNAESTLGPTIEALRLLPEVDAILVVDDGSTDRTAEIARQAAVELVTHPINRGKGAALNTGLAHLRGRQYLALALVDSDLGPSARAFGQLLKPVLDGAAEMTIARFPPPKRRGGFGLAKGFCRLGLYLFTGTWFASPMSGQRVLAAKILGGLSGFAPGWGCEPALTIDLHRLGARILEIPVPMSHAETGRTLAGFLHRGRQVWAAAQVFASRAVNRGKRKK
ncbi:MAG: glycosyltransferase family 2 protein [Bacteroidota bacterium]